MNTTTLQWYPVDGQRWPRELSRVVFYNSIHDDFEAGHYSNGALEIGDFTYFITDYTHWAYMQLPQEV